MKKLPDLIPISMFNKGHAGKIFKEVKTNNEVKLVVKNNEVEAVIISLDQYNKMLLNDLLSTTNSLPKKKNVDEIAGILNEYVTDENRNVNAHDMYKKAIDEKYKKKTQKIRY